MDEDRPVTYPPRRRKFSEEASLTYRQSADWLGISEATLKAYIRGRRIWASGGRVATAELEEFKRNGHRPVRGRPAHLTRAEMAEEVNEWPIGEFLRLINGLAAHGIATGPKSRPSAVSTTGSITDPSLYAATLELLRIYVEAADDSPANTATKVRRVEQELASHILVEKWDRWDSPANREAWVAEVVNEIGIATASRLIRDWRNRPTFSQRDPLIAPMEHSASVVDDWEEEAA